METIGQSAGKSFSYLLGVYLGDGSVTRTSDGYPYFSMNVIDADFANRVVDSLENLTTYKVWTKEIPVKKSKNPAHFVRCGDVSLANFLVQETKAKTEIPGYVFTWPRENQIAFIEGLMDSEGYVAKATRDDCKVTNRSFCMGFKSCDVWFDQFLRLLEMVGIRFGKVGIEQPRKAGYKVPKRVTIKMQSWIDSGARFSIARKQNRVDEWASSPAYANRAVGSKRLTSETLCQTP